MPQTTLEDVDPPINPDKVGISYSGGGPQLLVELGCARAFVECGIRPAVIAGVSAGALAGTAHALDPVGGTGIKMAANLLAQISTRKLGLNKLHIYWRLLLYVLRAQPKSLGDNAPIGPLLREAIAKQFPGHATIGDFNDPLLMVGATNRSNGSPHWYGPKTALDDALIASSAIPGIFPWRYAEIHGQTQPVVDGGVVSNQPISELVMAGCGRIYACAVGYGGEPVPEPTDAASNAQVSIYMAIHQTMKLEEDYARLKIGSQGGMIVHIHPDVKFPVDQYDFTPEVIAQVIHDSCEETKDWLKCAAQS